MIHCVQDYDPPAYTICCNGKQVEADFDKDVFPLDEIYVSSDGTKFTPEMQYSNCPKCLESIRNADLKLEPDPED